MKRYLAGLLISLLALTIPRFVQATSIDEFDGTQNVQDPANPSGSPATTGTISTSTMLKGMRAVKVISIGNDPSGLTSSGSSLGRFRHSQDFGVKATTVVAWNGSADPDATSGLGGLNITQDGSSKFRLCVTGFDYPDNQSVDLQMEVWSDLFRGSSSVVTVNHPISGGGPDDPCPGEIIDFVFSGFTALAPGAVLQADFQNVGAIRLLIKAPNAPAADLQFAWLRTDQCPTIYPNAQGIVRDECGVCGGDNTSCADCTGVPNGTKVVGTPCITGEPGVCSPGTYAGTAPNCQCARDVNPSAELCDTLDNNCNGSVDETFAAQGLGQSCTIGSAPCTATGQNVCTQNGGMTCTASAAQVAACEASKGCDNVPGSGLVRDICGICGGNGTSCLGCDQKPFSNLITDACGICGGDGSSCLDCAGTPFGALTVDRCDVCGGDGNSCLGCVTEDLSPKLTALDGGAIAQDNLIRAIALTLSRGKKLSKAKKAELKQIRDKARELHIANWTLVWTRIPVQNQNCSNTLYCPSSSNMPAVEEYRERSEELRQLAYATVRLLLGNPKRVPKAAAAFLAEADKIHANNVDLSNTVPTTHEECRP